MELVALAPARSVCWAVSAAVASPVGLRCCAALAGHGFHCPECCMSVRTQLLLLCSHGLAVSSCRTHRFPRVCPLVYSLWDAGAGSFGAASLTLVVGLKASSHRAGDRTGCGQELSRLLRHTPFVAVYLETYGCQMNVNDTEIAWAILQKNGYARTKELDEVRQHLGSFPGAQGRGVLAPWLCL